MVEATGGGINFHQGVCTSTQLHGKGFFGFNGFLLASEEEDDAKNDQRYGESDHDHVISDMLHMVHLHCCDCGMAVMGYWWFDGGIVEGRR